MNFYDVLAAEKWGGGIPTINFFDLLFAQYMGGGEQWETYEGTLPATLNANGDDMRQYQVYGAAGGVGDRTENYLQVTPDMYIAANWEEVQYTPTDPTKYFMYFELPKATKDILAHLEEVYANVYLIGTHYNFLVFAITDDKYGSVATEYRIIQNNGDILSWAKDVSSWEHIYLCIGYGQGIIAANKQTLINAFFDNYNLSLTEDTTPPASFVPFGYGLSLSVSDGTNTTITPIYIGDEPLDKDEYVDYQAGKIYRYETEIKKDVSQTGWQWRWETDDVTYQKPANNRVSVGRFYPEETKEYIISAVPDTFEVAVISADSSDVETADTGWGASWTLSGASAHSFCVTVRKFDNSDITPSEVDGVKFKVTSLTPTDPPVSLPALPTCEGTTVLDYAGQSVAPEKVYFEYQGGK